jgi:Tfp pilus assembly protein PilO
MRMRTPNRWFLLALPVVALLGAFWFLVLSPKREEAAKLGDQVAQLQSEVAEQQQLAAAAEEARERFPTNYRRLVVLGKAVPEDSDTSSLLLQLDHLAAKSGVDFRAIALGEAASTTAAPTPAPAPATPATAAEQSEQQVASAETGTSAPAAPTEAAASTLPLGASVGEAGLAVMPYELRFEGNFFSIAKFVSRLNRMVSLGRDGSPTVFGRLLTIDGFELSTPDETDPTAGSSGASLEASFAVTTYVTPPEEGLTAGATPEGPVPQVDEPVPASSGSSGAAPPTVSAGAGAASVTTAGTP